jgi:hypothetical protein
MAPSPTLLTSLARRPARGFEPKTRQHSARGEIEPLEEIEASPRLELFCKNTFLTAAEPMSPSLRPFYRERSVQTCPGAQVGCLQGLFDNGDMAVPSVVRQTQPTASPAAGMPPTPCWGAAPATALSLADMLASPPSAPPCVEQLTARVLVQVLPFWQVPQMAPPSEPPVRGGPPSVGSALHGTGKCRPCAFLHTRGCEHGTQCAFCHSCGAGERKRRKQAKVEMLKATRRQRQPKE